jgi:hypothetical protein
MNITVLLVFAVGLFAYGFSCDIVVGTLLTVMVHRLLVFVAGSYGSYIIMLTTALFCSATV